MVSITSNLLWATSLLGVQEFALGTLGADAFLGKIRTNQRVLLLALPGKEGARLEKAGKTQWEHRNPQLSSFRWHQHLAKGRERDVLAFPFLHQSNIPRKNATKNNIPVWCMPHSPTVFQVLHFMDSTTKALTVMIYPWKSPKEVIWAGEAGFGDDTGFCCPRHAWDSGNRREVPEQNPFRAYFGISAWTSLLRKMDEGWSSTCSSQSLVDALPSKETQHGHRMGLLKQQQ